jgi:Glycosyl transferase family 2
MEKQSQRVEAKLHVQAALIVPTLRRPDFLYRCLRSLESQRTSHSIEVLVGIRWDDDVSRPVIKKFSDTLRIRQVEAKGVGVVGSMNSCLAQAQAEFVGFVDDDVELPPDWVEMMIRHLENHTPGWERLVYRDARNFLCANGRVVDARRLALRVFSRIHDARCATVSRLMEGPLPLQHPGDGHPAEVWMTETNTDRSTWLKQLMNKQQVMPDDPRLIALSHQVGAKALLRALIFHSHKGVYRMEIFAVHAGDLSLGVIPDLFSKTLEADNYQLTERVRAQVGPQLKVLARVNRLMKSGQALEVTRPLAVTELVEHQPRLVFKGDRTPEHPDRFNRDDFACLPFQLAADKYAIGYYVVTRNMVHDWNSKLDPLDPARYDMPEQTFDLTLRNLRGAGGKGFSMGSLDRSIGACRRFDLEQKQP